METLPFERGGRNPPASAKFRALGQNSLAVRAAGRFLPRSDHDSVDERHCAALGAPFVGAEFSVH